MQWRRTISLANDRLTGKGPRELFPMVLIPAAIVQVIFLLAFAWIGHQWPWF